MSAEIGVSLEDAARVLDLMLTTPESRGYAGVLAFRYVKRSRALLAFTKFDLTCTIELPAAFADRTLSYYNAVWQGLEDAGIPYTLHWGRALTARGYLAAVNHDGALSVQLLDQNLTFWRRVGDSPRSPEIN